MANKACTSDTLMSAICHRTFAQAWLVFVLVLYSVIGAVVFQAIEGGGGRRQTEEAVNITEIRLALAKDIASVRLVTVNDESFIRLTSERIEQYEKEAHGSFSNGEGDNDDNNDDEDPWNFWGSMFYCVTVYTTIGYGHIAPSTSTGRIATILYALVGIPLCLVVLADFGRVLTRMLKYLWSFIRRFYYTGQCQTIVHSKPIALVEEQLHKIESRITQDSNEDLGGETPLAGDDDDDDNETENENVYVVDDEFNLPPIIAIMVTVAYVLLGSVMYMQWEDWDYLEAFYFIFISISTIGFGDVLPDHPKKFMASFIYLLFGLALVAMLITVIMDVVTTTIDKAKTRVMHVGKSIGINLQKTMDRDGEQAEPEVEKKAN